MNRMKKIFKVLVEKKKVVMLSFEIFWIIVFLLDMIAAQSGTGIPQFVYVNF